MRFISRSLAFHKLLLLVVDYFGTNEKKFIEREPAKANKPNGESITNLLIFFIIIICWHGTYNKVNKILCLALILLALLSAS